MNNEVVFDSQQIAYSVAALLDDLRSTPPFAIVPTHSIDLAEVGDVVRLRRGRTAIVFEREDLYSVSRLRLVTEKGNVITITI